MELYQGCRSKAEQEKLEKTLTTCSVAWPSPQACEEALSTYSQRHFSHALGVLDALIGATTVSLDLPIYSFNQRHYAAFPNLKVIQPYRKKAV